MTISISTGLILKNQNNTQNNIKKKQNQSANNDTLGIQIYTCKNNKKRKYYKLKFD